MERPDLPETEAHTRVRGYLERCHRRLEAVADDPPSRQGADALGLAIERAEPRPFTPTWLPVLDTIGELPSDDWADDLGQHLVDVAADLPWIPTPRADDGGTELALAPIDTAFDLGHTVVGLMYVGPGATYPLHHHPPQELYLTIAGTGRWRYDGAEQFETVEANATIYNRPGTRHCAVAGPSPVVALYILW